MKRVEVKETDNRDSSMTDLILDNNLQNKKKILKPTSR